MDINEDILNGIWYELMVANALTALTLVHNPGLSSEERGFVAGVASAVIEADDGSDGSGDNPDEGDESLGTQRA